MDKITVVNKEKKPIDKFDIWVVTDDQGRKFDTFNDLEVGQSYEGEIKENSNPAYNANFSLPKKQKPQTPGNSFGGGGVELQKRKAALEATATIRAATIVKTGIDLSAEEIEKELQNNYNYLSK